MGKVLLGCVAVLALSPAAMAEPTKPLSGTPDTGAWEVTEKTSTLDGSVSYLALLYADNTVTGLRGRDEKPILGVECDHLGFFFNLVWPARVDVAKKEYTATLTWRTDDGPVRESDWRATKHGLSQMGNSGLDWARRWSTAKTLVVRVPDKEGDQEATFHLAGLEQVVAHVSQMNCGG
jgi:hypothetical protein